MDKGNQNAKNFGKRIREIRLRQGITSQMDLAANKAGLDRTYIGGIERGERNPSFRNILKIANALKVEASELFKF